MTAGGSWGQRSSTLPPAAALAILLFAVALFNGRPAFFADTPLYYSQGQTLAAAVGIPSAKITAAQRQDPLSVAPGSSGEASSGTLTVAAARSPIYGLLLYLCERLGGLWLLVGVQCLAAAWTIVLAVRCVAGERGRQAFLFAVPVLVLASSLPFFTAFTMPDVFAGLDVLAAALLFLYQRALRRRESTLLFWILTFGAASHTSNLLTLIALVAVLAALQGSRLITAPFAARSPAILAAACGTAVALSIAAGALYTIQTGRLQGSPPFLMARVLEDGPGRAYLANHCPAGVAEDLCPFRRLALNSAEDFLWSGKPGVGVFMRAPLATRRRLKAEEPAFVWRSILEQPVAELIAAARNWGEQITLYATVEPMHNPGDFRQNAWGWRKTPIWTALPGREDCERSLARCQMRIPRSLIDLTQSLSIGLSLTLLILVAVSSDLRAAMKGKGPLVQDRLRQPVLFMGFILLAVILNAGVCGVLSGPFPRYQARLIWLIPLTSVLLLFTLPWRDAAAVLLTKTSQDRAEGVPKRPIFRRAPGP